MFKKVFEKFMNRMPATLPGTSSEPMRAEEGSTALQTLIQAVDERRQEDPLIGAKIGAKEVYWRAIEAIRTDRGIHAESLLCALSSVAGYACQASLRRKAVEGGALEHSPFMVISVQDGKRYFYGEALNYLLVESRYSILSVAAGAAKYAGCERLPDIGAIFKRVSEDIGGRNFGIPHLPEEHRAHSLPVSYLKTLWPMLSPVAELFCRTFDEWPVLFGLAIQEAIYDAKKAGVEPGVALTIVMESAVPMSKVELECL